MYKINCLNPIAEVGMNVFTEAYEKVDNFADAQVAMVRSAAMHDMDLPEGLLVVARAGAGVNNIPLDKCAEQGIVVFNTPGANANGVKEAVLAGMFLAARDIVGGVNWVQSVNTDPAVDKLVEKGKKQFAGTELKGKKLGVIGLGAIGVRVANACSLLGMEVYGYDPFISVDAAWSLSRDVKHISNLDDIYANCDYITVHVPLMDSTRKMINVEAIEKMKDQVIVLNFARDLLVDDAQEVRDFVENGNIKNSVNYPACDMGVCKSEGRVVICHKNIPNILSQLTSACAAEGVNIDDMTNKSKAAWAYTMRDINTSVSDEILKVLAAVEGVVKVRKIK